ncbi:MAG: hypothetical protein ABW203_08645 [Novosphingobium sp.]
MATIARSRPDLRFRSQAVPPLPHPSWRQAGDRPRAPALTSARDFWDRLGL